MKQNRLIAITLQGAIENIFKKSFNFDERINTFFKI